MFIIKASKALLSLLIVFSINSVIAEDTINEFDLDKFKLAQKEGKTILLDFYAPWCSTCKKQQPILKDLSKESNFENFIFFKADYDSENILKQDLKVQRQSTLILFEGDKEIARSVGITDKTELKTFLNKAL